MMKFINIRNSYAIERTLIVCPIPEQPHSIPI